MKIGTGKIFMLAALGLIITNTSPLQAQVPVLSNPTVDTVESTTALLGATITSEGGSDVISRGTVWNTSGSPVTENALDEGGTEIAEFNHIRESLPPGTLVYFRGYATNASGTGYSPDGAFYTEPATQPSGITFTGITDNSLRIRWTPGDGDGTIAVMQEGSGISSEPVDGIEYRASAAFGSGDEIGAGSYVIFKGSGSTVDVSGLKPGTVYSVALYEYAGSGTGISGINYQQTAPAEAVRTTSIGSVIGKVYNITIYSMFTQASVSTLSFFDDGYLQFSAFRGFGLYTAAGNFFWGSYWTPNFQGRDLLIVFTGVTFGPYLSATGVSTVNANMSSGSFWFFLGHQS